MTIRFNFAKFDKATAFQIIEQDPDFRDKKFTASNGITFIADVSPAISDQNRNAVYLRGKNSGSDLQTIISYYSSNGERDAYYDKLLVALDEFSKNKDQWTQK